MPGQTVLRDCTFGDLESVVAIERASFPDPYPLLEFAAWLSISAARFVVACVGDELVGYAIARRGPREGEIISIAVAPGARRTGVGRALMEAAMEYLDGCQRIQLMVEKGNAGAIALYRSFAFKETGRVVEGYYPSGGDALEFERTRPRRR